jgi:four helix bundle protein
MDAAATGEHRHHLSISRDSLLELETQLLVSRKLGYLNPATADPVLGEIEQISKMLAALISKTLTVASCLPTQWS